MAPKSHAHSAVAKRMHASHHPESAEHERHRGKHHSKPRGEGKVGKVMHEFKHGELHSGSKKGPVVHSRKQAIAIGMHEAREAGEHVKPMRGKRGKHHGKRRS